MKSFNFRQFSNYTFKGLHLNTNKNFNNKYSSISMNILKITKKFNTNNLKFRDDTKPQETIDDLMGLHNSNYNQGSNLNTNINKRRTRLSFLRDGMIITFYLRKVNIILYNKNY